MINVRVRNAIAQAILQFRHVRKDAKEVEIESEAFFATKLDLGHYPFSWIISLWF